MAVVAFLTVLAVEVLPVPVVATLGEDPVAFVVLVPVDVVKLFDLGFVEEAVPAEAAFTRPGEVTLLVAVVVVVAVVVAAGDLLSADNCVLELVFLIEEVLAAGEDLAAVVAGLESAEGLFVLSLVGVVVLVVVVAVACPLVLLLLLLLSTVSPLLLLVELSWAAVTSIEGGTADSTPSGGGAPLLLLSLVLSLAAVFLFVVVVVVVLGFVADAVSLEEVVTAGLVVLGEVAAGLDSV